MFEDQGSGYPLRVSKVTLKWTGPVKILPKGELESNLVQIYRYRDIPILTTMDPPPLGSWMRIHMVSLASPRTLAGPWT